MNGSHCSVPVCIPMEVKARELNSRLFLAYHLVKKGYSVLVGDRMGVYRELNYLRNPLFFSKGASSDYEYIFRAVKKRGGLNFVLFEEGAMSLRRNSEKLEVKSFYPDAMLPYIDVIFSYGKSFSEVLMRNLPDFYSGKVLISGNPRFDLHKQKYRKLYEEKIQKIQKSIGDYILFDTNFVAANSKIGLALLERQLVKIKEFSSGFKDQFLARKGVQEKILKEWVNLVIRVANEFKDINIVLRPHPGENPETYKKMFENIGNIIVTNEGEATSWIHGSMILVHYDCTTGLEGFFTGKPILSYTPYIDEYNHLWLPIFISDSTSCGDALIQKIGKYLSGRVGFLPSSEVMKTFEDEIINVSQDSIGLILKAIEDEVVDRGLDKVDGFSPSMVLRFKRCLHRFKDIPRQFFIKNIINDDYYDKFPGLSKHEIVDFFKLLMSIDGQSFQYVIEKSGANTFLLKRQQCDAS